MEDTNKTKSKEDPLYDKPGDGTLRSESFSYKKSVVQRGSQNLSNTENGNMPWRLFDNRVVKIMTVAIKPANFIQRKTTACATKKEPSYIHLVVHSQK
jgi:hypothetical protein